MADHAVPPARTLARVVLICGVSLGTYWLVFGQGVLISVGLMFDYHSDDEGFEVATSVILEGLAQTLLIVAVLLIALRIDRRWWPGLGAWPWSSQRAPTATVVGAIGLVMAAFAVGDLVIYPVLDGVGLTVGYSAWSSFWGEVWWSLDAAVGEEIVVLAVPVAVMHCLRVPRRSALWILVGLRVAYHLYYTVTGVWWLIPWAIVSAVVYWTWQDVRLLVGLIAVHFYFDMRYMLFGEAGRYVVVLLAGAALVAAWHLNARWFATPPTRPPAQRLLPPS